MGKSADGRGFRRWSPVWLAMLALAVMGEVQAMGKMCMFSAVQGVVTEHGKPVQGAVIRRGFFWHWKSERGSDEATTDEQGHFALPAIWRSSLFGTLLPHEPVVEQQISIEYGGKSYVAWSFMKGSYQENDELFGRPLELRCPLENEPVRHRLKQDHVEHDIFGICELP